MTPLEYLQENRETCLKYATSCLSESALQDADDVIQTLSLYLLENNPTPDPAKVPNYIFKAIANICNGETIKESSRSRLLRDNTDKVSEWFDAKGMAPDPLEILEYEQNELEFHNNLSDLEREVHKMILIQGVSYKNVAEALEMSEAAVRQHVSRIKKKYNEQKAKT